MAVAPPPTAGGLLPPEKTSDRLTRIAARLIRAPLAAITLVDEDCIRICSAFGLEPITVPRAGSFCSLVVAEELPLLVRDSLADPDFRHNRLVQPPFNIRFYLGVPLPGPDGRPIGTLCCLDQQPRPDGIEPVDIAALTDLAVLAAEALRREAEAERLAERNALLQGHFHAVVEAVPLPLITIDAAGLITGWNPAAERVFGWTAAEVIGRYGPHRPPEAISARAMRAEAGAHLVGVAGERMRRDGSRIPVAISTAALRQGIDRPEGAVVIIEDISERRRTEAEAAARLARSTRQATALSHIATTMPAAGEDLNGAMVSIAAAAAGVLEGCEAAVWLREPQQDGAGTLALVARRGAAAASRAERLPFPPEFGAALMAERQIAAEDALADPRLAPLREGWLRPAGIGALLAAPIRAGQEVLGLVAACRPGGPHGWSPEDRGFMASLADLAAVALEAGRRAQAMTRLAAEKDRAEAASRAKSLLLGTMGHELRTPLNAIIGFAELLRAADLARADQLEFAGHVLAAGRHLLGVFNAMLDQARIEAGTLILQEAPVALPALLEEAAAMVRPEAARRGMRLNRLAEAGMPPLRADADRLRQSIVNLIANAVKFSADGGQVEIGAGFDPEQGFRIWVADEGPGMAADDLPRAFEPFRQLDEGLRRRASGAGLGLPLTKAFVEAHGGRIDVVSAPGQGTRISVILPAARALPVDDRPAGSAS